jgi:Na+/proline symporter
MCAGFYGVVLADLVQGVIIVLSCFVVSFIAWNMIPSAQSLSALAGNVTGAVGWTNSAPVWHTNMPPGYEMYESLIMFALFYLIRNLLGGPSTGGESRFFGARNDRECGLQSLQMGIMITLRWPMMVAFAVMGIYLVNSMYPDPTVIGSTADLIKQSYPGTGAAMWHDLTSGIAADPAQHPAALIAGLKSILGSNWADKLPLVGFNGSINPERILPAVIMTALPVGLKGFVLVALFAAMMSTFTSTVNGASAMFVRDIYQNLLRPRASNRELISASYLSTLGVVVVGFVMGITAKSINDLWGWIIMSLTAGSIAPGLLRLHWWRLNAWGMAGGTVLGGVGAVVQRVVALGMVEWQQFLIMTSLSFAGAIGLSLATQPTSMDRLVQFYRRTRPFGFWGPVKAKFAPDERALLTSEHRNDILAMPFAVIAQVSLLMLAMQLVIKTYGSFAKTLPIFLVGAIGLYVFWWRNLPSGKDEDVPEVGPEAELSLASAVEESALDR